MLCSFTILINAMCSKLLLNNLKFLYDDITSGCLFYQSHSFHHFFGCLLTRRTKNYCNDISILRSEFNTIVLHILFNYIGSSIYVFKASLSVVILVTPSIPYDFQILGYIGYYINGYSLFHGILHFFLYNAWGIYLLLSLLSR